MQKALSVWIRKTFGMTEGTIVAKVYLIQSGFEIERCP
jgi:hypothetical protein